MRKICVVTGTRAEYGLLVGLIDLVDRSTEVELQLVATGMHLSPEFGNTVEQIEADGYQVTRKVESLLSADTPSAIAKSTGLGLIGFADVFADIQPDIVVLLGDRFEILSAAIAALYGRIPVAHIHGGETTLGAFDEGIRHAITKMAHIHFVAAEDYRRRVVQLGEQPDRVFQVGGLGVDVLKNTKLLSKESLELELSFCLGEKFLLITFHPVTLEAELASEQFGHLLGALRKLDDEFKFVFTLPNSDTGGRALIEQIKQFIGEVGVERAFSTSSMGRLKYWSAMKYCSAVVGNSSSGLLEAPSLKKAVVNIGERQFGRIMPTNVVNCSTNESDIGSALDRALSPEFQATLSTTQSPLGEGGASARVFEVLKSFSLSSEVVKKKFHDLEMNLDSLEDGGSQ